MDSFTQGPEGQDANGEAPTYAAFSPATSSSFSNQRSTILVHQKSPLLLATPPQITRALAYSHPFITPLSKLAGLLSWSTDDPWESFLLVAAFWAVTLYGDITLRWAGPPLLAVILVAGLFARRFSPLSTTYSKVSTTHSRSSSVEGDGNIPKAEQKQNEPEARHHKSLDEVVSNLQTFTQRCNLLLQPFLELTSFLSTQTTATSTTTSPALTRLFIRLLFLTPLWYLLTLPPLRIITTKRVILSLGTVVLSWHSRPARISRIILWRSKSIRRICSLICGLDLPVTAASPMSSTIAATSALKRKASSKALNDLAERGSGSAIRFSFSLFENQRRWLGIGWTANMLAYERAAWTDEELNATESKDEFSLPRIDGGVASWRWAKGSEWVVDVEDGAAEAVKSGAKNVNGEERGWIYMDTKWRHPVRGKDGWGKYTRRRKWVRDAELVDLAPSKAKTPVLSPTIIGNANASGFATPTKANGIPDGSSTPVGSPGSSRKRWFRRTKGGSKESIMGEDMGDDKDKQSSTMSLSSDRDEGEDDGYIPMHYRGRQGVVESDWGVGDELSMEFG